MKRYRIFSPQCNDLRWLIYLWLIVVIVGAAALLLPLLRESVREAEAYKFLVPAAGAFIAVIAKIIQDLFVRANSRLGAYDVVVADIGAICLTLSSFRLEDVREETGEQIDQDLFRWKLDKLRLRSEDYFSVFDLQIPEITGLRRETLSHITQFYTLLKGSRDAALGAASWHTKLPQSLAYCELSRVFRLVVCSLEQAKPVLAEAGRQREFEDVAATIEIYNQVLKVFQHKCQTEGAASQ
ncbi:MAG: hypothetical protein KDI83_12560 [Gammaproteobacteria bacterium]|nr:hypothetical protein [Gammaproteobacteria bacterium]